MMVVAVGESSLPDGTLPEFLIARRQSLKQRFSTGGP